MRVGVVGLGAIGQRIISQFHEHNQVEVVAICDRVESLVNELKEKLGSVKTYTNYEDLIVDQDVDLVYVAVPPKYHYEVVMKALKNNKHVLCEKPLANSLSEAKEMMEKAINAGVVHVMNFPLNYGKAACKFEQLLKSGYIGQLRRLQLTMQFPEWPRFWQKNDWVASREQGGFVLEVGVHFIQQMLKLFGEISNVQAQLQFPGDPTKSENGIIATAELSDGTPVLIEGLSDIPGVEYIGFTAYGTEGAISLVNWGELKAAKLGEEFENISVDDVKPNCLIDELIKAVNDEDAEIYDFQVGFKAQEILELLRKN